MTYYDSEETRDPATRERMQMAIVRDRIEEAKAAAPYYHTLLADVEAGDITDRASLAALPITRKSGLAALQAANPPYGGLTPEDLSDLAWFFMSPGPLFEPGCDDEAHWSMARALFAAGFRKGDLVHNTFSYHMTPGAWIFDTGARHLGCRVIPAGTGNTDQQIAAIAHYRPDGYIGTPDYLKVIVDRLEEADLGELRFNKALVSGGALLAPMRRAYADKGIDVYECYATGETGLIAYQTEAREGLIVNENLIVEIIDPLTGRLADEGEIGEVVITTLRRSYPLIRFATGDLSAVLPGTSPCGRTGMRLRGWLGHAEQAAKVRGMFVRPDQIAAVMHAHPEVGKARLVIEHEGGRDEMTLHCEVEGGDAAGDDSDMAEAIANTLKRICNLRGEVRLVPAGSLPSDGKVIADMRDYG